MDGNYGDWLKKNYQKEITNFENNRNFNPGEQ